MPDPISSVSEARRSGIRIVVIVEWGCDQITLGRRLDDVLPAVMKSLSSSD